MGEGQIETVAGDHSPAGIDHRLLFDLAYDEKRACASHLKQVVEWGAKAD